MALSNQLIIDRDSFFGEFLFRKILSENSACLSLRRKSNATRKMIIGKAFS